MSDFSQQCLIWIIYAYGIFEVLPGKSLFLLYREGNLGSEGMKWIACNHAAGKQNGWGLDPGLPGSEPCAPCAWPPSWPRTRAFVLTASHCTLSFLKSPWPWVRSHQAFLVSTFCGIIPLDDTQLSYHLHSDLPGMWSHVHPGGTLNRPAFQEICPISKLLFFPPSESLQY